MTNELLEYSCDENLMIPTPSDDPSAVTQSDTVDKAVTEPEIVASQASVTEGGNKLNSNQNAPGYDETDSNRGSHGDEKTKPIESTPADQSVDTSGLVVC
jgi:hypothetical protein